MPPPLAKASSFSASQTAPPLALGDRLAILTALLRPMGSFDFLGHVVAWSLLTALVVMPGAVIAGFQFPLLVALLGEAGKDIGKHTGSAYAWNTLGAILGSLAGGFGLLPLLSAPGAWRVTVGLLVLLGLVALLVTPNALPPAMGLANQRVRVGSANGANGVRPRAIDSACNSACRRSVRRAVLLNVALRSCSRANAHRTCLRSCSWHHSPIQMPPLKAGNATAPFNL